MIRKESDKLFRNISKEHVEVLLRKFGIDVEVIAIHPTTGLSIDNKYLEMDFVIEIKDHKMKDLEFQTTKVTKKVQYRSLKYAVYLSENTDMDSEVLVISSVEEPKVKILNISEDFKYPLKIYSLKSIDGDKILNRIIDKLSNSEKLTLDEYIDLVIMGYYNCKNPAKNIKSAIEILTGIKDETADIEQLITFQYLMYNKFQCQYEELKEAEGLFEMRLPAFEESLRKREEKGIEKGIEKGREEGIKKGGIIANLNNAIRMFDENVSTKDVIKFTRIPEENAQYISSLSGNGYTHNEILEFVLKKFYPNLTN